MPGPALAAPSRKPAPKPVDARSAGGLGQPSADFLDAAGWQRKLHPSIAPFMVARTVQEVVFEAQLGHKAAEGFKGDCVGWASLWIRLHAAHPLGHPVDRVNALGSFEGVVHAHTYASSYVANFRSRVAAQSFEENLDDQQRGNNLVHGCEPMDALYGLRRQPYAQAGTPLATAGKDLGQIVGYAMIDFKHPNKPDGKPTPGGHVASAYRAPGSDELTLFDPNMGEFRIPVKKAQDLLDAIDQYHRARHIQRYAHVSIEPIEALASIDATPLAALAPLVRRDLSPPVALEPPLPPVRDPRSVAPERLPPADQIDDEAWQLTRFESRMPPALRGHALARIRQGNVFLAHFGEPRGDASFGLSSVWLQQHQARPHAHPVNRLNTVGSYESVSRALELQKPSAAELETELKKTSLRGLRSFEAARAAAGIQGYHRMRMSRESGTGERFAVVFRVPGSDQTTLFDPDLGEFDVPAEKTEAFFTAFADWHGVQRFDLLPVKMDD